MTLGSGERGVGIRGEHCDGGSGSVAVIPVLASTCSLTTLCARP